MTRTSKIDIRVKPEERKKILSDAQSKGYDSISDYIRAIALGRDLMMGKTIIETNMMVKKLAQELSNKEL